MKNIRVYGDSYCSAPEDSRKNWTSLLSKKLKVGEINRAVSGTSNAVIYTRLKEDIQHKKFSDSDTECIIVQFSTPGRYYNDYIIKKLPNACSLFSRADTIKEIAPSVRHYYEDNKEHIRWAMSECSFDTERHHMETTLYWLKHYVSAKYPNIKIVVLFNWLYPVEIDTSLLTTTENFICLDHLSLTEASFSESGNVKFPELVKFTKTDVRWNHFTRPNLEILADSIFNIIKTNDKSCINYDSFHKNIFVPIRNKTQYNQLIDKGILSYRTKIYDTLPD